MIFNHAFRCATLIALSLFLSACSLVPHQSTPQVDIAENTQVNLPTPASLGYQLAASQLITASWVIDGKPTSEQLPVQLQVTSNEVVLAGFSSWGTRVLSLSYDGEQIQTEVLNGLQAVRSRSVLGAGPSSGTLFAVRSGHDATAARSRDDDSLRLASGTFADVLDSS